MSSLGEPQEADWQKPRKPDYPANPPPACFIFMPTVLAAVLYAVINVLP